MSNSMTNSFTSAMNDFIKRYCVKAVNRQLKVFKVVVKYIKN